MPDKGSGMKYVIAEKYETGSGMSLFIREWDGKEKTGERFETFSGDGSIVHVFAPEDSALVELFLAMGFKPECRKKELLDKLDGAFEKFGCEGRFGKEMQNLLGQILIALQASEREARSTYVCGND